MLVTCWSVKGGSGTTVVAACLALAAARRPTDDTLLVDLAGDLPAALGVDGSTGPGVHEWLAATGEPEASEATCTLGAPGTLAELAVPIDDGLALLCRGEPDGRPVSPRATEALIARLHADGRTVIVDAGTVASGDPNPWGTAFVQAADRSLLVTRACYLGLRHLARSDLRPDGAVLVAEPGRSLGAADVAAVAGAPVVAEIRCEPQLARLVDAGLLQQRIPKGIERALVDLVGA